MSPNKKKNKFVAKPIDSTILRYRRRISFKTESKFFKNTGKRNLADGDNEASHEDKKEKQKLSGYKKAYAEYEKIKTKKNQEREEAIKRKMEIKQSLEKYKLKKRDKFKKLAAKTRKGQPIMKNRIEMMLEKIQSFK